MMRASGKATQAEYSGAEAGCSSAPRASSRRYIRSSCDDKRKSSFKRMLLLSLAIFSGFFMMSMAILKTRKPSGSNNAVNDAPRQRLQSVAGGRSVARGKVMEIEQQYERQGDVQQDAPYEFPKYARDTDRSADIRVVRPKVAQFTSTLAQRRSKLALEMHSDLEAAKVLEQMISDNSSSPEEAFAALGSPEAVVLVRALNESKVNDALIGRLSSMYGGDLVGRETIGCWNSTTRSEFQMMRAADRKPAGKVLILIEVKGEKAGAPSIICGGTEYDNAQFMVKSIENFDLSVLDDGHRDVLRVNPAGVPTTLDWNMEGKLNGDDEEYDAMKDYLNIMASLRGENTPQASFGKLNQAAYEASKDFPDGNATAALTRYLIMLGNARSYLDILIDDSRATTPSLSKKLKDLIKTSTEEERGNIETAVQLLMEFIKYNSSTDKSGVISAANDLDIKLQGVGSSIDASLSRMYAGREVVDDPEYLSDLETMRFEHHVAAGISPTE